MHVKRSTLFPLLPCFPLACLLLACSSDMTARLQAPLQVVEVRIPVSPSLLLAGTLTLPALPRTLRAPVVMLVGGSGPQDRDGTRAELPGYRPFRDLALALGAAGIAVLRLDDRGTGASSGQFGGATTIDFAGDVAAALRWLRARPDVDGAHPALLGHSEGAVVALLAASRDTSVSALVLLGAPSRTGRELARWQRAALVATDAAEFPPGERRALLSTAEAEAERLARNDAWMGVWFALDPRAVARDTRAPVLLLHGENDRQVPVEQAEELASVLAARGPGVLPGEAQRGDSTRARDARESRQMHDVHAARDVRDVRSARDVELRRFPATDHLFLEDHDGDPRGYVRLVDRQLRRDVTETIVKWLVKRLAPRVVANDVQRRRALHDVRDSEGKTRASE